MKAKIYLLLAVLVVGSFSVTAQDQSAEPKQKVKVHVKITENGKTEEITREVESEGEVDVDSILRELGVLEGMELTSKGQQIEVDIKKKTNGMDDKDVSVHMRSPRHAFRDHAHAEANVDKKSRAFMGVYIESMDEESAREKGLKSGKGAYISSVIEGTSAEKAGLKEGEIITKFDGQVVEGQNHLIELVRSHKPGDVVEVEVYEDGHFRTVSVELGEKKIEKRIIVAPFDEDGDYNFNFDFDFDTEGMQWNSEEFERQMEELGKRLGEMGENMEFHFDGMDEHGEHHNFHFEHKGDNSKRAFLGVAPADYEEDGVKIGRVIENSTAEAIGLEKGDIIYALNGEEIDDFEDLAEQLREAKPGDNVSVEFERDGKKMKLEGVLKSRSETKGAEMKWHGTRPMFTEKEVKVIIEIADITEAEAEKLNEATGIDVNPDSDLAIKSLQFAPNPSNGDFNLTFELPNQGNTEIKVYDGNGRQVYYETLNNFKGSYNNRINISNEPNGVYFLIITQKDQQFSKKIIKQ